MLFHSMTSQLWVEINVGLFSDSRDVTLGREEIRVWNVWKTVQLQNFAYSASQVAWRYHNFVDDDDVIIVVVKGITCLFLFSSHIQDNL